MKGLRLIRLRLRLRALRAIAGSPHNSQQPKALALLPTIADDNQRPRTKRPSELQVLIDRRDKRTRVLSLALSLSIVLSCVSAGVAFVCCVLPT